MSSFRAFSMSIRPPEEEDRVTELFRWHSRAELYLIDFAESALLQKGEFTLSLVQQRHSPLASVEARVGEVQWPVGTDSPVIRVGSTGQLSLTTFALPGLTYGLILPSHSAGAATAAADARLKVLLQHYAMYHELDAATGTVGLVKPSTTEEACVLWTSVAEVVDRKSCSMKMQASANPTPDLGLSLHGPHQHGDAKAFNKSVKHANSLAPLSPRMMKKMQKARRMSAVAKLFSKTLARGAIKASSHVDAPASPTPLILASVDAVAGVLDGVERASQAGVPPAPAPAPATWRTRSRSTWTLNHEGRRMLLHAIKAYSLGKRRSHDAPASNASDTSSVTTSSPPRLSLAK